jgi:GNAT superfamily N-acetyltransferase
MRRVLGIFEKVFYKMKTNQELLIRTMNRKEMDFAVELAAKEGWNPGVHDAACFYDADPEGFLIGYVGADPVGCISAVSYENIFGFIGFYIVLPGYRGQGYGIQLWNRAMIRLKDHVTGLDGVFEQQADYCKSGFKPAYRNIRFECPAVKDVSSDGTDLVPIQKIPFEQLEAYDRQCFPAGRRAFLKAWIEMPQSYGVGCLAGTGLCGYGLIRKCRQGYKIGPLFADDADKADRLYIKLSSQVEKKEKVYLDVPEVNRAGLQMAEKYRMRKVFETARMYKGEEPKIALGKVFGVTTFELG